MVERVGREGDGHHLVAPSRAELGRAAAAHRVGPLAHSTHEQRRRGRKRIVPQARIALELLSIDDANGWRLAIVVNLVIEVVAFGGRDSCDQLREVLVAHL